MEADGPMREDEQLYKVPEEIPSPEELFHTEKERVNREKAAKNAAKKSIPRYKVIKRFSAAFLLLLLFLVLGILNLDKLGIHYYCMASSSMESVIPKDSFLVVYKEEAKDLKAGDIITFENADHVLVTHEIVEVVLDYDSGPGYRTKGTDNAECDQYITAYKDVIGKVIFHIPYVGKWMTFWK